MDLVLVRLSKIPYLRIIILAQALGFLLSSERQYVVQAYMRVQFIVGFRFGLG